MECSTWKYFIVLESETEGKRETHTNDVCICNIREKQQDHYVSY